MHALSLTFYIRNERLAHCALLSYRSEAHCALCFFLVFLSCVSFLCLHVRETIDSKSRLLCYSVTVDLSGTGANKRQSYYGLVASFDRLL